MLWQPAGVPAGAAPQRIAAQTVLWAAGVAASPIVQSLGIPLDRAGRVAVEPTLAVPGVRDVFVVGDLCALEQDGRPLPGVAQVAMQEGRHAARNIVRVLSSRPLDLSAASARGALVEQMGGEPAAILAGLAERGAQSLYVDGGVTIQRFLRAGLVDRLVVSRVPVLIGEGIPLFGGLPHDVLLRHVGTRAYPGGLVQSEYTIAR